MTLLESHLLLGKSVYENSILSNLSSVLVNVNSDVEITESTLIKMNLLQLRYFLEIAFVVSSKINFYNVIYDFSESFSFTYILITIYILTLLKFLKNYFYNIFLFYSFWRNLMTF